MGHDVDAIGRHNLRTDTLLNLAEDLAKRFNSKVKYGYINNENLNDDFSFMEQGGFGEGRVVYCVHDTYHFERKKDPDKYINNICYEVFLQEAFDEYNAYIFRDSFLADVHYYSRWWSFCGAFMLENDNVKPVSDFRKEVRKQVALFGGDTAIYFDDQANGNNHTFDLEEMGFEEFKHNLLRDGSIIDISSWIESGAPVQEGYPLGFIDDFKSLGSTANDY